MNWLKKKIIKWFKITPCKKCGSWDTRRGYFTSGWNNYCQQASGDRGVICNDCIHVEFDKSLEERRAIASKYSPWVDVYPKEYKEDGLTDAEYRKKNSISNVSGVGIQKL